MRSDYRYPHIPLSKLRQLRKVADQEIEKWTAHEIWLFLIRQEIDRLIKDKLLLAVNAAHQEIARQEMIIKMYEGDEDDE